jgi:hypothetical protein
MGEEETASYDFKGPLSDSLRHHGIKIPRAPQTEDEVLKRAFEDIIELRNRERSDISRALGAIEVLVEQARDDLRLLNPKQREEDEIPRERIPVDDAGELLKREFKPREPLFEHDGLPRVYTDTLYLNDGLTRAGKGTLSIAFAVSLATGRGWDGWRPIRRRTVCIVTVEDGRRRLRDRIAAMLRGLGLMPADLGNRFQLIVRPPGGLDLSEVRDLVALKHALVPLEADFIVLDNLTRLSGVLDESLAEIKSVMERIESLRAATGAALLLTHHHGKNPSGTRALRSRGHSSIPGFCDAHLTIEREGNTTTIQHHDAKDDPDWTAVWRMIQPDEGEIRWQVAGQNSSGGPDPCQGNEARRKALNALGLATFKHGRPVTIEEVAGASGLGSARLREHLNALATIPNGPVVR